MKDEHQEFEDPVTLEYMYDPYILPCGHSFELITLASVKKQNCPLCRKPFTLSCPKYDKELRSKISRFRKESKIPYDWKQVFLKTLFGKPWVFLMPSMETDVDVFRKMVCVKTGVALSSQRLIYGFKVLMGPATLKELGIQYESTIHLVVQLRGD